MDGAFLLILAFLIIVMWKVYSDVKYRKECEELLGCKIQFDESGDVACMYEDGRLEFISRDEFYMRLLRAKTK